MVSNGSGARVLCLACAACGALVAAGAQPDWKSLEQLERAGRYDEALVQYQVIADPEAATRAAMRVGILSYKLGRLPEAVDRLESTMETDPISAWSAEGLYYLTRVCTQEDCRATAVRSVERLRAYHPGSAWTTRAERLLDGQPPADADKGANGNGTSDEDAADALYEEALLLAKAKLYEEALELLTYIAAELPYTRTALSAHLSIANISAKLGDRQAAIDSAEYLLSETETASPAARLVCLARDRLARVYRLEHRKAESLQQFDLLAMNSTLPTEKAEAKLEAAGAFMEYLKAQVAAARRGGGPAVDAGQWEALRKRCRALSKTPGATEAQLVRAELIVMESLHWEVRYADALTAAQASLSRWDAERYPQEAATAHLLAGESLQVAGQYAAALGHYRWITDRFGTQEVWPGLDLTVRAYFRVVDILTLTNGSAAEAAEALETVVNTWPNSPYADLVRALHAARQPLAEPLPAHESGGAIVPKVTN